jgi:hypothetical protein
MQAFHDTLDTCGLSDIGYVGDPFTWHRGAMRERLDRGIANASWSQMQTDAALLHLEYNHSDHRVLLLDTEYYKATPINGSKQNRFEAKWFKEEGFTDIVQEKWQASDQGQPINVLDRLKIMHEGLHEWDRTILQKPKKRLRKAQRELEELMRGPMTPESDQKKFELDGLIEKLLEQEEIKWSQRSRTNWIKSGDKNTSFFHSYASA